MNACVCACQCIVLVILSVSVCVRALACALVCLVCVFVYLLFKYQLHSVWTLTFCRQPFDCSSVQICHNVTIFRFFYIKLIHLYIIIVIHHMSFFAKQQDMTTHKVFQDNFRTVFQTYISAVSNQPNSVKIQVKTQGVMIK